MASRALRPTCPICRKKPMVPVYLGSGYAPPKFECKVCRVVFDREVARELNRIHRQTKKLV